MASFNKPQIALILGVLLLSGCISQTPVCNRPYILVGNGCCLDENNDKICDVDKPITTSTTEMTIPPTTSTTTIPTTTTTTSTSTTTTSTTVPTPKGPNRAIVDIQLPSGLVSEVTLLKGSTERSVVGDLYLYAYGNNTINVIAWDTTNRVETDPTTKVVYLPPDYEKIARTSMRNLTGNSIGDSGKLDNETYYVYSIKGDRIIMTKGLILGNQTTANYTLEYNRYKFRIYKILYPEQ
jgi:hypothetical protein